MGNTSVYNFKKHGRSFLADQADCYANDPARESRGIE